MGNETMIVDLTAKRNAMAEAKADEMAGYDRVAERLTMLFEAIRRMRANGSSSAEIAKTLRFAASQLGEAE